MYQDTLIRMLELMLYRQAGGTGYDAPIKCYSELWPVEYKNITDNLQGILAQQPK